MPAYSKTTWIDGSAPAIDATNLNKMEQGIFDSLRQDGSTTMSGQLVTTAGSAATPAIAPTGDSNTGIFFPAADTIAFGEGGTEAMRINSSGQVGIGTTTPTALTSMHGAPQATSGAILTLRDTTATGANTTYGAISFLSSPGTDFSIGKASENTTSALAFRNANTGAEFMRITSAGNVGIGTTAPDVFSRGYSGTILGISSSGQSAIELNSGTGNKAFLDIGVAGTRQGYLTGSSTEIELGSATGIPMYLITNNNIRATITSAGNVGIGTTSPTEKLQVNSTSGNTGLNINTADSGAVSYISLSNTGASGKRYSLNVGGNTIGSGLTNNLFLYDNDNAAVRFLITPSGNVGIGTTSPSNYSGRASVGVNGTDGGILELMVSGTPKFQIYPESSSITDTIILNANGGSGVMRFQIASTEQMRLNNNGYLLIGYTSSNGAYPLQVNGQIFATSSTIATSDGRYKKDVVALDGALDIVKALNPVQFSWKDHPVHKFNTDVPTVGFIAQEVEQALADKSYLTSIIKKSECTWETETGEFVEREVTRDVEKQVEREITEEIDGEEVTRTVTETVIEQVTEIVQEPVKETHTEEFLGIAESNLIAILTKAVQELTAKVEALEAQLSK